jgi:6-phosphogluconolactonase/glucosamine-6-phosphate isomerase/deaminase
VVSRICLITSESLIPLLGEDGHTAVVLPRMTTLRSRSFRMQVQMLKMAAWLQLAMEPSASEL